MITWRYFGFRCGDYLTDPWALKYFEDTNQEVEMEYNVFKGKTTEQYIINRERHRFLCNKGENQKLFCYCHIVGLSWQFTIYFIAYDK